MTVEHTIPVFRPSITEAEVDAVAETLRSGWLGCGPKVQAFEDAFAAYVGAKHAVAVNSCTAALHLAMRALGVRKGDTVIVPALTFVSTALAATYCGADVVFADVDEETLCIDWEDAGWKLDCIEMGVERVAIAPVHFGGYPCAAPEIDRALKGAVVIEDCAHAAGAPVGKFGDAACWSFHAVKNMTTGDGGMITTDRTSLVEPLRRMRWCGINKDTWSRMGLRGNVTIRDRASRYGWYYEVAELGWKYHMNDIAASIGLAQLARLDTMNARRRDIAEHYTATFAPVEQIRTPPDAPGHAWHAYIVRVPDRNALGAYLRERGISTGVHYMPLHLHPLYSETRQSVPVAESVWESLLTLPLFPDMTDGEVERVTRAVVEGVETCR